MELIWLIPVAGLAAVFYAAYLTWDVLRRDAGTPEMQDVGALIFEGALAFLQRQDGVCGHPQPEGGDHGLSARRSGLRLPGGGAEPAGRLHNLLRLQRST